MANKIKYPIIDNKKECGDCHKYLPIAFFNKARNHYTSRCKDCISIYLKKYRSNEAIKTKIREYQKNYKLIPENRKKINKRLRNWKKTEKGRATSNRLRKAWTLKEKKKAIQYKGGGCTVCGYNKCEAALDFHHTTPELKIKIKDHLSFINQKAELDKCVLLCCRCHRELHSGLIKL